MSFSRFSPPAARLLAAAQANGAPLQISQMAVGDGDNGGYYTPSESQTALKHETWRGALNHLAVDTNNPNWVVAEAVLPDTVGGFTSARWACSIAVAI